MKRLMDFRFKKPAVKPFRQKLSSIMVKDPRVSTPKFVFLIPFPKEELHFFPSVFGKPSGKVTWQSNMDLD